MMKTMRVVTIFSLFFISFFSALEVRANTPNWSVDPSLYQQSMTIVALLKVNGLVSSDPQDLVGVFIGGEVRGVGSPEVRLGGTNQYLLFVQVYSNGESNEVLTFRIYDASLDEEVDALDQLHFESDMIVGSIDSPYLIADNYGPTDIVLSHHEVLENAPVEAAVGILSAQDRDADDIFTFTLVPGAGADGNDSFRIDDHTLQTAEVLDFEMQNIYSVRVRATDASGEYIEKVFTLMVLDENDAPGDIILTPRTVSESAPLGANIGMFSIMDEDINPSSYTYALVAGEGDEDNNRFLVFSNTLLLNTTLDFEEQVMYSIRVRTTDDFGTMREKAFSIMVQNENEAPTNISFSRYAVGEHIPVGDIAAVLLVQDPDRGDDHTFALMNAEDALIIEDGALIVNEALDYEEQRIYFLDMQVTDIGGLSFTRRIEFSIQDENDPPRGLLLSDTSVEENAAAQEMVGRFMAVDQDNQDTFTYTLSDGEGSEDNVFFAVQGDALLTMVALNHEETSIRSVRVRVTDRTGAAAEQAFSIAVENINEPPTDVLLDVQEVSEDSLVGAMIGIFMVADEDRNESHWIGLVSGAGDEDNANFIVEDSVLRLRHRVDYETQQSHAVRIGVRDGGGLMLEEAFSIQVLDGDDIPDAVLLSMDEIPENAPAGTVLGVFSLRGANPADPVSYTLETYADGGDFEIAGDRLQSRVMFDYEEQVFHRIRVSAVDKNGIVYSRDIGIVTVDRNEAPTALRFFPNSVGEHAAVDTPMGVFRAEDVDRGDVFTYALVEGAGSDDNAHFVITGMASLRNRITFDYEQRRMYQVRVRVVDSGLNMLEQAFSIEIGDENDAPTSVSFRLVSAQENQPAGVLVGSFMAEDPDAGDVLMFSLVEQGSASDNRAYVIDGDQLLSARVFDAETQSVYRLRVRAVDTQGAFIEDEFVVQIENINDPHMDLSLMGMELSENTPAGYTVGVLSVEDQEESDEITYGILGSSLEEGFRIVENRLLSNQVFDYETQALYSVSIEARDQDGYTVERVFEIEVLDADDPPMGIALSESTFQENMEAGQLIGEFSVLDGDVEDESMSYQDLFSYRLTAGEGSADNDHFYIEGNRIYTGRVFNHEEQDMYRVRVRSFFEDLEVEEAFMLRAEDVNDAPSRIVLSLREVKENMSAGTLIGVLSCEDEDERDAFVYRLFGAIETIALFEIRGNQLYTRATFDAEQTPGYTFEIEARDVALAVVRNTFTVEVQDVNDAPKLLPATFSIPEGSIRGTLVGTVNARDDDVGSTLAYTLYLSNNPEVSSEHFSIQSSTGRVFVEDPDALDFEQSETEQIAVIVSDDGVPTASDTAVYVVNILDLPDQPLPAGIVFSPNGDGMNDYWVIEDVENYERDELLIFNELGQVVFRTRGYQNNWDGTYRNHKLPIGVYHYIFRNEEGEVLYKGAISIIR